MQGTGINVTEADARLQELERDGKTVMLLAINEKLVGIVAVADTVKEGAAKAVALLDRKSVV